MLNTNAKAQETRKFSDSRFLTREEPNVPRGTLKCSESVPKVGANGHLGIPRRITRRMTRQRKLLAARDTSQAEAEEHKITENETVPEAKKRKKGAGNLETNGRPKRGNREAPKKPISQAKGPFSRNANNQESDFYLATMINDTKNSGLAKTTLKRRQNQPFCATPREKDGDSLGRFGQKSLKNRGHSGQDCEPAGSLVDRNRQVPRQNVRPRNEHPMFEKDSGGPRSPLESRNLRHLQKHQRFEEELKMKIKLKNELKLVPARNSRKKKKYFLANHGEHAPAKAVLGKRDQLDSIGNSILDRELDLNRIGFDSRDLQRVKSRSIPTEKLKGRLEHRMEKKANLDVAQMGNQKSLSIRSEECKRDNSGQIRPRDNGNLADNLSNFEEGNLDLGENIARGGVAAGRRQSPKPEQDAKKQFGFEKGFTKKIERIFEKSGKSCDFEAEQRENAQPISQAETTRLEQMQMYLDYRLNMINFLGFERTSEIFDHDKAMKRIRFLERKGGVDKNYWLNYYCSVVQKGRHMDCRDKLRGQQNCISYSLKEYNNNYNHKIHQAIFNMGKLIYKDIRDELIEREKQRQWRIQSMQMQGYYPHYSEGMRPGGRPPLGTEQRMNQIDSYVHPQMYINRLRNQAPRRMNKYFPCHNNGHAAGQVPLERFQQVQRPVENRLNAQMMQKVSQSGEESYNQEQKPWETNIESKNEKLELVRMNNEIGGNEYPQNRPENLKREAISQSWKFSDRVSRIRKKAKKKNMSIESQKRQTKKIAKKPKQELKIKNEIKPKKKKKRKKESEKRKNKPKTQTPQKESISSRKRSLNEQKNDVYLPPEEPAGNDSSAWVKYFSQVNLVDIKRDSRSYKLISGYFPLDLEEVIKYEPEINRMNREKKGEGWTVEMSKLGRNRPFSRYYNPKERMEQFSRDFDVICAESRAEKARVRELGKFRKHIRDHLNVVTSIVDISNLLENQDKDLFWEMIAKKDSAIKDFIMNQKMKRLSQ